MEASRQHAYGGLEQQLKALVLHSAELQRETGSLASALRTPQVRGRWGELTLHRVVELAGLTEHCDYVEQATLTGDTGRLRPDMIVRLPGGRQIVVDAKAPLTAYLDAMSASTSDERDLALVRHAQQVRQHMGALAGKGYWEGLDRSAELVVMFIPGEAFVGAAAQADPTLIEDGMARKVVIATPTTLVALLRAVAFGWRQEQLAANAEHIRQQGQALYERVRSMVGNLDDMGDKLRQATTAYNKAVGSFESRVLPAARRFRDIGAGEGAEIPTLTPVDEQPRVVDAPEAPRQLEAPGLD
jgi:DNA recombination protein RmuC